MSTLAAAPAGGLGSRLWTYQRERFPLAMYAPMVIVFTASAAYYSRFARGAEGFIPAGRFAVGARGALHLPLLSQHA